nr:guanine nucleotide-binding protein subunit beta-like protein 1 [Rhipicephalus microplus]
MSNRSPDPFYTLRGHGGPITAVEFFGDVLFSGSSDGEIFSWDLETFRRRHTLVGHNNKGILWIGHSENALLTQGRDGTVAIWTLNDSQWKQTGTMVTSAKGFCQCSLPSEASTLIATPSDPDWKISLWDLESQKCVASTLQSKEQLGMAMSIRLSRDGNGVLAAYENGSVVHYDMRSGGVPVSTLTLYKEPIMCMDFDQVHRVNRGICGSVSNELCVFELNDGQLAEKRRLTVTNDGFSSLHVRVDGKIVASGGWDGRIRVFGWKNMKPLAVLDFHKESVQAVKFSDRELCKAGLLLAAGSKDRTVSLWSLYNSS